MKQYAKIALCVSILPAALIGGHAAAQTVISHTKLLGNAASIQAFNETVYPIVRENCSLCHGREQSPKFAVKNATDGHNAMVGAFKVDFNRPEKSRLVERLRFEEHNCWSFSCADDADVMLAAIKQWRNRILDDKVLAASSRLLVTSNLTFAQGSVGIDGRTSALKYDLKEFIPAGSEAYLVVDVIDFDVGSYVIRNPRIMVRGVNIKLAGLGILVNGSFNPANATYLKVKKDLSYPGGQLSGAAMLVLKDRGTKDDAFAFSFEVFDSVKRDGIDPPLSFEELVPKPTDPVITVNAPVIEAEKGSIGGAFAIKKEENRTFIASPENNLLRTADDNNAGVLTFKFIVPTAGEFKLLGLIKPDDYSRNSFYWRFDNQPFQAWGMYPLGAEWNWFEANINNGGNGVAFNLTKGEHVLQIREREDATPLDKLMILPNDASVIQQAIEKYR